MTREMKKTLRGRLPDGTANPIDIYVGNRIRLRRTLLGLSQEKLAEMLGITFQQVQKYEKGMNRIGASRLWDMSNVLDVPVSFFFSGLTKEETDKSPAALNGLKIEKEQADANDLTKQLEDLRAENDALRQKNADWNIQIAEHVKKCLYCKNLNFTQEIKFLDHKISELREENERLKGWLEFIATMQWGDLKDCKNYAKQALNGSEVLK